MCSSEAIWENEDHILKSHFGFQHELLETDSVFRAGVSPMLVTFHLQTEMLLSHAPCLTKLIKNTQPDISTVRGRKRSEKNYTVRKKRGEGT